MTVKVAVEVEPEVECVDVEEAEAVVEAMGLRYPLLQMRTVKNNKILRLQTRAARDP